MRTHIDKPRVYFRRGRWRASGWLYLNGRDQQQLWKYLSQLNVGYLAGIYNFMRRKESE